MKLFGQVLIITYALIGLLLFFKSSINQIKTGISVMVITVSESAFMVTARIGGKGDISRLMKEQFTEFLMSVREVPQ